MDESPKQLISAGQLSVPMRPGQEARVDYEYVRHGMVNMFMANEPLKGKRSVEVTEHKTKKRLGGVHQEIGGRAISGSKQDNTCDGQLQHARSFRLL